MDLVKKANKKTVQAIAWSLSAFVTLLAIIVWGNSLSWHFSGLSVYQLFPVFGLTAYSIMWSHYVISFLNKTIYKSVELGDYYKVTGYAVLLAIVLHPGLLAYQRFKDGFGLPIGSYTSYVQASSKWIVLLGEVSLLIFLAFEFQRKFKDKTWWKYVVFANDAAMIGIFYHGLRLGSNLTTGWFKIVWLFYGLSLISILIYTYAAGLRKIPTSAIATKK